MTDWRRCLTIAGSAQFAYAKSADAIWVNLYGASELDTELPNVGKVKLTQETEYPWSGRVRLKVIEATGKEFAIKLRIPGGVDTGARLRSAGNGEAGQRGGPSGDLYVVLHVRSHDIFTREGVDLICEMPVSFVQAALGSELEVPTLTGRAKISIPPGTQTGTIFRLKGRGVKNLQGYGQGDLHVRVTVEVPTRLNGEQKQKLQEFAQLCDEKVNPIAQSFFEKAKSFFR